MLTPDLPQALPAGSDPTAPPLRLPNDTHPPPARREGRCAAERPPAPPAAPAAPTAPDLRAGTRTEGEVVYQESVPIRTRHAGGRDLVLRSHGAAAPPWPDGTPPVAACDTYADSLEALADWLQQH